MTKKESAKIDSLKLDIDQLRYQNNEQMAEYRRKLCEWSKNVDKRYAWVILLALWLTFGATLGSYRIYGLVFARVTDEEIYTREEASWPVSMILTVENLAGPLVSIIAYHLSYRYSLLIGGLCIALGNGIAYWSNSLLVDILLIGFVQGIGYAFVFMPFMEVINSYFSKYRNMALGVALCGGTLSVFVMTPLFNWVLNTYHWRVSYLFVGAICCINILMVPLLKPNPKPTPPMSNSFRSLQEKEKKKEKEGGSDGLSFRALTFQNSMRRQSTIMVRRDSRDHRLSVISVNPFASSTGVERKISRAVLDTKASKNAAQEKSAANDELEMQETRSLHEIGEETANMKFQMSTIIEILKTPGFHLIWYLDMIYFWVFGIFCLILVDFGKDHGCSKSEARDLMMFQSLGEVIGRMGLTALVDMQFTSHRNMVCLDLILMAILLCTIPQANSFVSLASMTVVLNALASLLYILLNGLLVNMLGESKVTIGYGMASCVAGFLITFRPQAVGYFRDYIGDYEWLLISLGLACALGAILCAAEGYITECYLKKTPNKPTAISTEA